MNDHAYELTKDEFDELFNGAIKFTEATLKEKPKSIAPMLTVFTTDKTNDRGTTAIAIASDFNDWDVKCEIMGSIGRKLAEDRQVALAAVLISEAWISKAAFEEDVQPRHASDKREVIILAGMSIDRKFIRMLSQPVLRYNGGLMADGKPMHDTDREEKVEGKITAEFPLLHPFFEEHIKTWSKQL